MDQKKYIDAQIAYCRKKHLPVFMPGDGICFACGKPIFQDVERISETFGHKYLSKGIDFEEASSDLIIGCPHCATTYCD